MGCFNESLKIFYLQLFGVGHIVKYHSNSEKGNTLPPLHSIFFPNSSKGSFICFGHMVKDHLVNEKKSTAGTTRTPRSIPQTGATYHGLCYTMVKLIVC